MRIASIVWLKQAEVSHQNQCQPSKKESNIVTQLHNLLKKNSASPIPTDTGHQSKQISQWQTLGQVHKTNLQHLTGQSKQNQQQTSKTNEKRMKNTEYRITRPTKKNIFEKRTGKDPKTFQENQIWPVIKISAAQVEENSLHNIYPHRSNPDSQRTLQLAK